jgi:hypothetical protein
VFEAAVVVCPVCIGGSEISERNYMALDNSKLSNVDYAFGVAIQLFSSRK